jgi:spore germination protein
MTERLRYGRRDPLFGVDIAQFGNQLRIQHPRVWHRVKKDWDQRFKTTSLTSDINIHIQDYGMIGERNK